MLFEQCVLLSLRQIIGDHFFAHFLRGNFGRPAEFDFGFVVAEVVWHDSTEMETQMTQIPQMKTR